MKRILAPHKEQDGWRYVRVPSSIVSPLGAPRESEEVVFAARLSLTNSIAAPGLETRLELSYRDDTPGSRIISSRRVEEAVETADFLKQLTSEGMYASYWPDGQWLVAPAGHRGVTGGGTTLREAYYRYKAQIAPVAIEPDYRTCGDCVYEMTSGADEPCLSCVEAGTPDGEWSRPGYKAKAGDAE